MTWRTALKTVFLALPIGSIGPHFVEAGETSALHGSAEIAEIFDATCASGRITAASLREIFGAQGFTSDWQNDAYGYFTRDGFTANYHIYPGSWNCFVSAESVAPRDLCAILSADDVEINARLSDGTCVANLTEHGLSILVRNICQDSSQGGCTWMQATLTSDRECSAEDIVEMTTLSRTLIEN
ncbi:MAG: hypothetical protein AAF557_19935 [Pseudomonadota bacterium]